MMLELSLFGLLLAFGGGLVSFLSPCIGPLQVASGAVMVAAGIAIATGEMTRLAGWILNAFPVLATVG
jgi:cytochrome c-type biogenesis protein